MTAVAAIAVPRRTFALDVRAVKIVGHRHLIRTTQDRTRFIAALVQPLLFLFVLSPRLWSFTAGATGALDLLPLMFPGILATSTLFTAIFAAVSLVWDRE